MAKQVEDGLTSSPKRTLIILGALIAIIVVMFAAMSLSNDPDKQKEQLMSSTSGRVETTSADAVKAAIDLYRVQEGRYPWSYEDMLETLGSHTKDYAKNLPEFDYSRRGDGEAYRFTYRSIAGETVTVEGNYSEEYH